MPVVIFNPYTLRIMKRKIFALAILTFVYSGLKSQNRSNTSFIYSKDGKAVLNKWNLRKICLKSLNKDASDTEALSICDCQISKLNERFTSKEYKKFTKGLVVDLKGLIDLDSSFKNEFESCFKSTGRSQLLSVEADAEGSLEACIINTKNSTNKSIDSAKVRNFCACQLELIKNRKLTDKELESLSDPNSLLFLETMYKCGSPFDATSYVRGWNPGLEKDITGPPSDTINVLNMDGMTFVKIKMGSLVRFWLFDTGASDMLITKEMEEVLQSEKVMTSQNFTGIKEYEMANGIVDSCRTYLINGVKIGKFSVDNITVAVSDKAKRIIVGKSLINKFNRWAIINERNTLILTK